MVHTVEVQHDCVQPSEEIPARVKLTDLLHGLVERAENQFLGIMVVGAQEYGGRVKAVAIFGNEPFRTALPVFPYLLPDFHHCFGIRVHHSRKHLYSDMPSICQKVH